MILYEFSVSRSIRCRWMLAELGEPFESVEIDLADGAHKRPDFLRLNPLGRLPLLDDGGFLLRESAAICTYLGDRFPDRRLVPSAGTRERGRYEQWMSFCTSDLDAPLWTIRRHMVLYPPEKRCAAILPHAREDFRRAAQVLAEHLTTSAYVLGDAFSAADVVVGHTLAWAAYFRTERTLGLVDDFPAIERYLARLLARPACPAELAALANPFTA